MHAVLLLVVVVCRSTVEDRAWCPYSESIQPIVCFVACFFLDDKLYIPTLGQTSVLDRHALGTIRVFHLCCVGGVDVGFQPV